MTVLSFTTAGQLGLAPPVWQLWRNAHRHAYLVARPAIPGWNGWQLVGLQIAGRLLGGRLPAPPALDALRERMGAPA